MSNSIISATAKVAFVCVGLFVGSMAAQYAFHRYTQPRSQEYITAAERGRQLECLAQNIYREAGNEPFEGKVAVAQVTLNRTESGQFPKDICAVVYQKNVFLANTVCQFSWYCMQPNRLPPVNKKSYDESYEVAKKVLLENFRLDGLKEALYYHASYINPRWKKDRITTIGNHIFYK